MNMHNCLGKIKSIFLLYHMSQSRRLNCILQIYNWAIHSIFPSRYSLTWPFSIHITFVCLLVIVTISSPMSVKMHADLPRSEMIYNLSIQDMKILVYSFLANHCRTSADKRNRQAHLMS